MRRSEAGFTYLGLLIILAVIGVAAAGTLQLGAVMQRRAAEEQLLDIGAEFRAALEGYAQASPAGAGAAPRTLLDLVRDPRYPNPRRYLRKVYADPLTGSPQWGLLRTPDGNGILGVYSLAPGHPIKIANFQRPFQGFDDKTSYAQWIFAPAQVAPVPRTSPTPAAPSETRPPG